MKTPSAFECAIRALRQERDAPGQRILAIDMDACAAALCDRSASGAYVVRDGVKLDDEAQSPIRLYESALSKLPGGNALDEQQLSRAWRRYIQSEREDAPVVGGVTCAALESAFAPTAQLYGELFSLADRLLGDETRILLFGRMAARTLAVYAARSHFSADPFLPDPLFITSPHPERLVDAGRALLRADAAREDIPFGHSVTLLLVNGDGAELPVPLAQPQQSRAQLKMPEFGRSFLCGPADGIALNVDGKPVRVGVPESLFEAPMQLGMVFAGFAVDEEGAALHLRRAVGDGKTVRAALNALNME